MDLVFVQTCDVVVHILGTHWPPLYPVSRCLNAMDDLSILPDPDPACLLQALKCTMSQTSLNYFY